MALQLNGRRDGRRRPSPGRPVEMGGPSERRGQHEVASGLRVPEPHRVVVTGSLDARPLQRRRDLEACHPDVDARRCDAARATPVRGAGGWRAAPVVRLRAGRGPAGPRGRRAPRHSDAPPAIVGSVVARMTVRADRDRSRAHARACQSTSSSKSASRTSAGGASVGGRTPSSAAATVGSSRPRSRRTRCGPCPGGRARRAPTRRSGETDGPRRRDGRPRRRPCGGGRAATGRPGAGRGRRRPAASSARLACSPEDGELDQPGEAGLELGQDAEAVERALDHLTHRVGLEPVVAGDGDRRRRVARIGLQLDLEEDGAVARA